MLTQHFLLLLLHIQQAKHTVAFIVKQSQETQYICNHDR